MTKGEDTQQEILAHAAVIFGKYGYSGTSISHLTQATGLSKGALYNHFKNKNELAIHAFDYSMELVRNRFGAQIKGKKSSTERLLGMIEVFRSLIHQPLVPSGCPIQAASIEDYDTHPVLRQHAQAAMDEWRAFILHTVKRGKAYGEFHADVDGDLVATILMSTLEGGVMMSKLYRTSQAMDHAADYMRQYVATMRA